MRAYFRILDKSEAVRAEICSVKTVACSTLLCYINGELAQTVRNRPELNAALTQYPLVIGGKNEYLIMNLDWAANDSILDWAGGIIAAHPEHRVIVVTHTLKTVPAKAPECEAVGWNEHIACDGCDYTYGYEEITATEKALKFTDEKTIGNYAKDAVKTAQMADIVNGYEVSGKYEFRPTNTATRAEAAQILYKFHKEFMNK